MRAGPRLRPNPRNPGHVRCADPRCKGSDEVSAEDAEALKQLGAIVKALTEKK
jgi:hypothetical protein